MSISLEKPAKVRPVTVTQLMARKELGLPLAQPITMLTCYDYCTARALDAVPELDVLLVGDSLAMTVLGHPNTLSLTLDEMLHHVKAVTRGTERALVVADMPFMTYQIDTKSALLNAGRLIQEGHAAAVKVEGASDDLLRTIEKLVTIGIPVMGHLGFTPQSVNTLGGFKIQGKTSERADKLLQEAQRLSNAGVFSMVLELMPSEVATEITRLVAVPTIGIGAGAGCDGQVLVIDDMLGRYPNLRPKFVRQYADLTAITQNAVHQYNQDVRTRNFPNEAIEAYHQS